MVKGIRLQKPSPNALVTAATARAVGERSQRHDDDRDRDEDEGVGEPALGPGGEAKAMRAKPPWVSGTAFLSMGWIFILSVLLKEAWLSSRWRQNTPS